MGCFLSIISILIVIYSVFIIIYRMFEKNDLKLKIIKTSIVNETSSFNIKECWKIFAGAMAFRIFIIIISILVFMIFINQDGNINISDALNNWVKWDANNYLRIADSFYFYTKNGFYTSLAFFPLYPFFIMIFKLFFDEVTSGLIISNLAFSLSCVFIYKLVCMDYGKKTAISTLIILNIFPFSFFFSSIMSESVFILFSSITLYYIRKHKWMDVGVFGLFCALSRSIGVFIIIPALVEIIEEYNLIKNIKSIKTTLKILITKILPLMLIPLGFMIYLYFNYRVTGEWFYFLKLQKQVWNQSYKPFYLFFQTNLNSMISYNTNFNFCILVPQIILIIFSYIVLLFNLRKNRTMYLAWLLVNIIINTSLSWPLSVCRYMCCAIPLFIFVANFLKKHRYLYMGYIIANSILMTVYFIAYLKYMYVF